MKRHASMNRLYRIIWSEAQQAFIVVSELAKGHCKARSNSRPELADHDARLQQSPPHWPGRILGRNIAHILGISLLGVSMAYAEPGVNEVPTGGQITQGSGSISQNGNTLTVQQNSDKMIGQWNTFNIGEKATVNVHQPSANSIALNRINDSKPSEIYGKLNANGQVYLQNSNGVIFGKTAQVDVGGLVASTQQLSDEDFRNGKTQFKANGNSQNTGRIENHGHITAHGGVVAFIAPQVSNSGSIQNNGGTVAMAAGEQVTLDFEGDGLVKVKVDKAAINALAENKGLIQADGGTVIMTAQSANALMDTVVNNDGIIQAHTLENHGGRIVLDGGDEGVTRVAGTVDADASSGAKDLPTTAAASLPSPANETKVEAVGGTVIATGNKVLVDEGAHLSASGKTGGGKVLVGGSWQNSDPSVRQASATIVAKTAKLEANATDSGNGGTVVAWSDVSKTGSVTRAYGTFEAKGGPNGGDGGRIETSGHWLDTAASLGSAAAPNGKPGEWLFDPYNVTITGANANGSFNGASPDVWTPSASGSTVLNTDIQTRLSGGTNVTITTTGAGAEAGDITVSAPIVMSNTLSLLADGAVTISANISGSGQLILQSGASGAINQPVTLNNSILLGGGQLKITSTGGAQSNAEIDAYGLLELYGSGNFNINSTSGTSDFDNLTANITGSGSIDLYENNDFFNITANGVTCPGNVTLRSKNNFTVTGPIDITDTGNLTLKVATGSFINSNGPITINSGSMSFVTESGSSTYTIGNSITASGAGLSFDQPVTLSGSPAISANGTLAFNAALTVAAASNTVLTANDFTFTGNVTGNGTQQLTLKPYAVGANISLGTAGTLDTALAQISGFSALTLGRADGTGAITLAGGTPLVFSNPTTFLAGGVGGTITVDQAISTAGTAGLSMQAGSALAVNQDITTVNGAISLQGSNVTIANTKTVSTTGTGNIAITGTGTTGTGTGVSINGGTVQTTGSGNITITGTGSGSGAGNTGIFVNSGTVQTTGGGNITLTGYGSTAGTLANNEGITIADGLVEIQSGLARTLTLNGTGGIGTNYNVGVNVRTGSSTVRMSAGVTGQMNVTGIGGSCSGTGCWGVLAENSGVYESLGAASINLTGTGGTGADNMGINYTFGNGRIGSGTMSGDITLTADTMNLTGTGGSLTVRSTGALTVKPLTAATTIGIAGGAGTLALTAANFATNLVNGFSGITVGNSTAGAITVGGALTLYDNTTLESNGAIALNNALSGENITLTSNAGVSSNSSGNVSAIDFVVNAAGAINLSGVNSITGTTSLTAGAANNISLTNIANDFLGAVSVASGNDIAIKDDNDITLGNVAVSGNLTVEALSGDLTVTGSISKSSGSNATATLKASNNIIFNFATVSVISTPNQLNTILWSDSDGDSSGGITIDGDSSIGTTGSIWMGGGSTSSAVETGFSGITVPTGYAWGTADTNGAGILIPGGGADGSTLIQAGSGRNIVMKGHGDAVGSRLSNGAELNTRSKGIDFNRDGPSSQSGFGVSMATSGTGFIILDGIGGATTGNFNYGVNIHSGLITSVSGEIIITGQGGGSGGASDNNHGVYLEDDDNLIQSTLGSIALDGIAGPGASTQGILVGGTNDLIDAGFALTLTNASGSGLTLNGTANGDSTLDITTDSVVFGGSSSLTGTASLLIEPATASTSIGIAGGTGTLQLSAANFLTKFNGFSDITVGNSTTGVITIGGATTFTSNIALISGNDIAINGTLNATGLVDIATDSGNLTVSQNITTTDTSVSAVVLNSGEATAAGITTGGNIIVSGSPTITTGAGGRATFYTGNVSGSTGLTALIGSGSGNFRYNSDESTSNYSAALGAGNYAVYREQAMLTVIPGSATSVYGDAVSIAGVSTTVTGFVNGDDTTTAGVTGTANFNTTVSNGSHVGTYNIAYISGLGNTVGYGITDATGIGEYSVTARTLTPTLSNTGVSKVYDGTTAGNLTPSFSFAGLTSGDSGATLSNTGMTYNSAHVANATQITVSGLAISSITGSGLVSDYVLDATSKNVAAVITAATLTPTLSNTNVTKSYDGTTSSNLTPSFSFAGLVIGDTDAILSNTGIAYNSAHVANAGKITVSGLTIGSITGVNGSVASDYVLDATAKDVAATITAAILIPTLSNTNVTKIYDGSTGSNLTPTFTYTGLVAGDTDATLSHTGIAYDSAHVANATQVTVSGLAIDRIAGTTGSAASDYVLDADSKAVAAAITAATLTPTLSNTQVTKSYDGTPNSSLVPTFSYTGLVTGDTDAILSNTGIAYDSAHVANAGKVTVSGLTIGSITGVNGSVASDYVLDAVTKDVAATITTAILSPMLSNTNVTKTYDGVTSSNLTPTFNFTGLVAGDADATLSYTGIAYDNAHVVNAGKVTVSGLAISSIAGANSSAASDYVLDAASKDVTATITAAILIPTLSNTNITKTYDGSIGSNLTPTFSYTGLVAGDTDATLSHAGIAYDSAHVANASKVTVSGLAISRIAGANGSAVSDYVLDALSKDVAATITAATLTPTLSNTQVSKTYDGTTAGNLTPTFNFTGLVAGDTDATLSNTGIAYNSAHVADAAQVTVSGLAIGSIAGANGSLASDYVLDADTKAVAAAITAATLTPTLSNTQVSKIYDGTTFSDLTPAFSFTGLVAGDTDANLSYTGIAYDSAHVADAAQVTVSGLAISTIAGTNSSAASDYVLDAVTKNVAASITAATLTPTLSNTNVTKTYDGTTDSKLTPTFSFTGLIAGDTDATLSNTGIAYDSAHVATAGKVTVSGLAIGSIAGSNSSAVSDYVLDAAGKDVAASITAATLTPTLSNTKVSKTYDGTTNSNLTPTFTFVGLVAGDTDATLSNTGIAYDSAHVAEASQVTVSGLAISTIAGTNGSAASDYVLDAVSKNVPANIIAATLTSTLSNINVSKTYDGTPFSDLTPAFSFTGLVAGDTDATLSNTGLTYDSAHVADASQVTVAGLAISGIIGANGSLASDYLLDADTQAVAASITAATLTPTLSNTNVTKIYDGSTNSNLTPTFNFIGLIAGDTDATLSNTGIAYDSAHVADATQVSVSGLAISSIAGSNSSLTSDYVLDADTKAVAASITAATLTPTLSNTNVTKTYDGTTNSNLTPTFSFAGLVAGDSDATLSNTGLTYDSAHVADATQVTVAGLAISSIAGSNSSLASDYVLDADTKNIAASITAATLTPTLSNTNVTKTYDGTTNSNLTPTFSLVGLVAGDTDATLSNTGIAYDSAHVAYATQVTVAGLAISGIIGANGSLVSDYLLDADTQAVAASITAATLTPALSNTNVSKTYDGTTAGQLTPTFTFVGLIAGDTDATLSNTGITYDSAHVADATQVTVSGLAIGSIAGANSSAASDYVLDADTQAVAATITAATLTPTLSNTNVTKTYDGSTFSDLTPTFSFTGLVAGDTDASLSNTGIAYDSAHVADATQVTVSGLAIGSIVGANGSLASDYVLDADTQAVAATITAATLTPTLSNTNVSKTYDGTTAGNLTPTFSFTGLVAGDTDASLSNTGIAYDSAHVADATQVIVSGLAIGSIAGANGSAASDYVLDADTKNVAASITAAALTSTLSNTNVTKTYDGTTAGQLTPTFSFTGLIAGDTDAILSNTGIAYDSAHVAEATQVTVSGLAIGSIAGANGSLASDYVLDAGTQAVAANITAATLTPALSNTNVSKTYDGTTTVNLTPTFSFTGLAAGDTDAALSNTGLTYDSAHVADATQITVSGLAISSIVGANGSLASDYLLDTDTQAVAANITAATLTPTLSNTNVTKLYDGTTFTDLTPSFTVEGLIANDTVILSHTGVAYNSAHVADATHVIVSGLAIGSIAGTAQASDYVLDADTKTVAANITAVSLAPTLSNTNVTKTYDGTTDSNLTPAFSFTGLIAGDTDATLSNTGIAYDSVHVANAGKVTVSGLAIGSIAGANGSAASDYVLNVTRTEVAANITAATLTPTLFNTNVSKTYDGTTGSNLTPIFSFTGLAAGDTPILSNTGMTYDSAHVADATQLTVSGLAIRAIIGTGLISDYVLDADTQAVAATITPATLIPTLSNTNVTKTYDGTTDSNLTPTFSFTGLITGDTDATLSYTGLAYDSAHVANATQVKVSGLAIGSIAGANNSAISDYVLDADTQGIAAGITAATLTPTLSNTNVTKTYDGTTASNLTPTFSFAGLVAGDSDATLSHTGIAYDSTHVATAGKVTVSGLAIDSIAGANGSMASDYVLDAGTKDIAAGITAAALTPVLFNTDVTKTYDGTDSSDLKPTFGFVGLATGDIPVLSNTGIAYDSAHVADATQVTVSGLAIRAIIGTGLISDYILDATSKSVPANITPATLTATVEAPNKVYDGTTAATPTLTITGGLVGDETVTATGTGSFNSKDVLNANQVSVNSITLIDGTGLAGDYSLSIGQSIAAFITPKTLTASVEAPDKIYDGTTAVTALLTITGGLVGDETVTATGSADFNSKDVLSANQIIVNSATLIDGTGLGSNYSLGSGQTVAAHITPKALTASVTAPDKVYDGTTAATPTLTIIDGLVGDESVTATGSADFNSKDVLSANQVIVNSTTLIDGTGLGSNYSLGSGQTVAAHITPKALSASVTAPDKVYDGTTTATPTLTITGGLVGDETVTATGSADFNSKDVLSANQVTVNSTDLIDGSGLGSNYSLGTGQTVAAHITPRNLNVTATGINKVYDGTTTATVTLDDNRVLNDMLILSNTGANFIDENVATAKLINVSGINITGADAANYFFNTATTATADIIAAALPPDKPVINEPITINSPATTTVISNVLTTATQQSTSGGSGRATIGISATNAAGLNMGSATITVMSNGTLVVDNTVDNPTTTANTDNKAATATAQDSQTGSAQSSAPSTAPTGSPGSAATLAQPTSAGNATTPGVSASPVPVKSNNTVAANKTAASQQPATANQTAAAPSQAASSSVGESVSQKTVEAAKTTLSDGISSVKPGVNGVDTLKTALVEAAVAQGLPRQQAEQASSSFARVLVQNLAKGLPMSAAIKLAQGAFNSVTSLSPPSSPQAAAAGSLASSGSGTESSLAALSGTTSSSGSAAFEASLSAGLAKGKSLEQAVQSAKNAAQQIDAALAMDHSPMGSLVNGGAEGLANTPLSFQNSLSNALAKGVPLEQALQRAAAAGAMADEAAKADAHRPGSGLSSGNSAFMKTLPATGDFDKTLGVAMSRGISIEQAITNAMQINALQQQGIKADGKSSLAGFSNGRQPSDQGDKHFDTALTSAIAHGLAPADAITRARQAVKNLQTEVQTPSTSLASGKNIDTLLSSLGHSRTFDKVLGKALARGVPMDNAISLAKRAEAASAVHFQLPAQLASAIPKNSKIEVTTGTGAPLPSWLNYTPGTHKLIAYDIPQGALPMQVVMTVNGKPSTVEITETGVH